MISEAIAGYWGNPRGLDECDHAKNAILARIQTPFHKFTRHIWDTEDLPVTGSVVLSLGLLGFRASILDGGAGDLAVFRTAIHEGAHLAGYGDDGQYGAYSLEDLCREPH